MAERRMFARSVIGSARFLRMPATSRLLYYDLGMEADDDGIVEAFGVIRKTGATEDDLQILVAKGFARVLNDDLVTFITDWKRNNQIRSDRYHPSLYRELILQISDGLPSDNQATTSGKPRLGKDSIGKDSIGESGVASPQTPARFSPPNVDEVREYCESNGLHHVKAQKFVDHYTANGWIRGKVPVRDWQAVARIWNEEDSADQSGSKAKSLPDIPGVENL